MIKRMILASLVVGLVLVTGCGQRGEEGVAPGEAQQFPAEAQAAIEISQADLAQRLGIDEDEIDLDSIMAPAEEGGTYVVRLEVASELYEYHVRDGEVVQVSEPLPPAEG